MIILKNSIACHIVPIGGIYVTNKPMKIQTVLGSCISVVLFDKSKKISGMNHILLPGSFSPNSGENLFEKKDTKYGMFSLESLVSQLQELGSLKRDMTAKIYGASYLGSFNRLLDIQQSNVDFVRAFLDMAKIPITYEFVLQEEALKIILDSATGDVEVIKLVVQKQ